MYQRSRIFNGLLLRACLLISMLAAMLATSAPRAAANAGLPSALFDSYSTGWLSVRNMTSAEHQTFFNQTKDKGFMLIDIEGDEINGEARYSSVWQSNSDGRAWVSRRDLSSDEFHSYWTQYRDQGLRLIDQDAYTIDGQLRYAGVWVENKEGLDWASYRNVSSEEFSTRFAEYRDAGFIPTDVEAYASGSNLLYSAIWVKNTEGLGWVLRRNMSGDEYADYFQQYKQQGLRVLDIESYLHNGQQYYAAIWIENKDGRAWAALRDMTAKQYGDTWLAMRDGGYRLIDFEVYPTSAGIRYAGVWRQNGIRPAWEQKDAVTTMVQNYVDTNKVAGLSVAIAQNGQFVYLRGFGYANIAQQRPAHSGTIFRLASVSKAVAGVLAMRLVEQNVIQLNEPTRTYAPSLPNQHTHRIRQLVSNRSGVRHYGDSSDPTRSNNAPGQYNTALAAAALFANDPLRFTPGTSYGYSTHAYTLLGAAMEGALGQPVATILASRLTNPFDLNTLRAEDRSQPNANRATLYTLQNGANVLATPDNISWKVLGGGLEASAYDLARMGIKLMNGSILSNASRNTLWTPPDNLSNFALGWDTGTEQGTQVVARQGSQTGARAYIRMYPEKKLVIVIL